MKKTNLGKDKLIGSLAILKSRMILGDDFISTYIPFVARVLIDVNQGGVIEISDVMYGFEQEYGFTIDRSAMTALLNKCAKKGFIAKRKNAKYEVVLEKCISVAINMRDVNSQYQKYNQIIQKLQAYYVQEFDSQLQIEELETILMSFLNEHSSKTIIAKFDEIEGSTHSVKQHHYIVSRFIKKCQTEDVETYQLVIDLAVSYLFTSAIAYGGEDEKTKLDSYKGLLIYLDTPFVLRVLGLNGEEMQRASLAILDQLYDMKCRFYIFSHTYDEISHILRDCYKWIESPQYDMFYASYALRTFVDKKFTKADVQEYLDTLENKLKFYHITIDDTDYSVGRFYKPVVDESVIESQIIQVYKEKSLCFDENSKKATIEYDTKSISNILKLWGNRSCRTYKQAKYVLLTTNSTLAYVTRLFDEKMNPSVRNNVYPCITDVFLGTNIWLGSPVNKIEDFSEKKLLADCMSLIEPSDALIRKLQESITRAFDDETITEDQYYLLKAKAFTNDYIMQKTLGDENYFTDKLAEELLEDIEKEIIQPYQNKIDDLSCSLNSEIGKKERALSEIESIKASNDEKLRIKREKEEGYAQRAEKAVTCISTIVFGCIIIPVASTIVNISGLVNVPVLGMIISIVLILFLPIVGCTLTKENGKVKECVKKRLIRKYKLKDFKKTL